MVERTLSLCSFQAMSNEARKLFLISPNFTSHPNICLKYTKLRHLIEKGFCFLSTYMIKDKAFQIIHKDNVSAVAMSTGSIIWYTLKHQMSTETSSPTVVLTDVIEK